MPCDTLRIWTCGDDADHDDDEMDNVVLVFCRASTVGSFFFKYVVRVRLLDIRLRHKLTTCGGRTRAPVLMLDRRHCDAIFSYRTIRKTNHTTHCSLVPETIPSRTAIPDLVNIGLDSSPTIIVCAGRTYNLKKTIPPPTPTAKERRHAWMHTLHTLHVHTHCLRVLGMSTNCYATGCDPGWDG